ncbi:MAG: MBOAT family protein [Candidatus Hydrogenedentota bacterium]
MLFNSWSFVFFFLTVLAIYWLLPHRRQNLLLVFASYGFYAVWDWRFLALIAFSTLVDFFIAQRIEHAGESGRKKQLLLLSIVTNLGLLGTFKYFHFFVDSGIVLLTRLGFEANAPLIHVILPVGISFYTFQTMAYTIDVYRGHQKAVTHLPTYALYVSYFPQLVAGPIERASRLMPQLENPRKMTAENWGSGAQLVLWGYVKKVVIADTLAPFVDTAYADPSAHDGLYLWLAMYGFAIQVYCDFSGYTDMARGFSRLLGINLMENFRAPFLSRSITEFWQRWHISLSTWLRDYLYIPPGGNRHGKLRLYRNLMITMILSGFWHGAGWTFVIWGALQGLCMIIHRVYKERYVRGGIKNGVSTLRRQLVHVFYVVFTFHVIATSFIFFRSPDMVTVGSFVSTLMRADAWNGISGVASTGIITNLLFYIPIVILLDLMLLRTSSDLPFDEQRPWWIRGVAFGSGLVLLAYVRGVESGSFVYFQF